GRTPRRRTGAAPRRCRAVGESYATALLGGVRKRPGRDCTPPRSRCNGRRRMTWAQAALLVPHVVGTSSLACAGQRETVGALTPLGRGKQGCLPPRQEGSLFPWAQAALLVPASERLLAPCPRLAGASKAACPHD